MAMDITQANKILTQSGLLPASKNQDAPNNQIDQLITRLNFRVTAGKNKEAGKSRKALASKEAAKLNIKISTGMFSSSKDVGVSLENLIKQCEAAVTYLKEHNGNHEQIKNLESAIKELGSRIENRQKNSMFKLSKHQLQEKFKVLQNNFAEELSSELQEAATKIQMAFRRGQVNARVAAKKEAAEQAKTEAATKLQAAAKKEAAEQAKTEAATKLQAAVRRPQAKAQTEAKKEAAEKAKKEAEANRIAIRGAVKEAADKTGGTTKPNTNDPKIVKKPPLNMDEVNAQAAARQEELDQKTEAKSAKQIKRERKAGTFRRSPSVEQKNTMKALEASAKAEHERVAEQEAEALAAKKGNKMTAKERRQARKIKKKLSIKRD